jgi:hypothetical protein
MTTMRYLAACIGLALLMPMAAMAQDRSTLDAEFPGDHEYVVAVWFLKKDKASTFHYRIMDPSIPRNYDRRAWEVFKTNFTDPNVGGEVRFLTVKSTQNSRQTERQQVMARVQQERDRIEFQDPKFVDVEPEKKEKSKQEPKKDSGKTTFSYDDKAKKSVSVDLSDTKWRSELSFLHPIYTFSKDGYVRVQFPEDGRARISECWRQRGNILRFRRKLDGPDEDKSYFIEDDAIYLLDGNNRHKYFTRVK